MHSIIRIKKHKSIASLKSRENHTYRRRETPNADPAKLHRNKLLYGQENYSAAADNFLQEYSSAGNKIRKDAVIAVEFLLTASPEFFDEGPKNERDERLKKWCEAQIEFMKKEHGEKNILCMYLHLDEKTPHLEAYVVPIDNRGKLNCKGFYGARNALNQLQTRYAAHNNVFGLQRGLKGSRATHQQVQKFYEQIKQPTKVNNENLQKAVKLEAPALKNILNPDVYMKEQEAKIYAKVARLFASTVYENKIIQQAKKILREWKRAEADAEKLKYKLESEKEALQEKLNRQTKAIQNLEQLQSDKNELQKQLSNAQIEISLMKETLSPNSKFK
ncbi:MobV family relaxase [Acidovorax sp. SUPP2825]|uniref:MobV family relaxase n=1 Tax=Acidovorax sp. SUPP2825 TaxID=2920879 RepID=UPI0023DE38F4|nr:MobV family relaxase [Acidovorax sp. SUPP2825]GKS97663.1 plasmid recombination protein [Acidovorax sp. SUPP2825]